MNDVLDEVDREGGVNLVAQARASGMMPAKLALQRGLPVSSPGLWDQPVIIGGDDDVYADESVDLIGSTDNVLSRYVQSICQSVQFPVNTAYLHGLGIVASAMTHNFSYDYHGTEKPVSLYVVTAQPPSTGKSAINGFLSGPVREAVKKENDYNKPVRIAREADIASLKKEMEKMKGEALVGNAEELAKKEEELAKVAFYRYGLTDATPESIEDIAGRQRGVFSVISDEADAINVILGNVYGDKKANLGLFLSAWDGDFFSSSRITRAGYDGTVKGSISVIAQDESIESILEAGLSGRGVSERFLMLRERNLLGRRDHTTYVHVDRLAKEDYEATMESIFRDDGKCFYLSRDAQELLINYKMDIEPQMDDSGKFGNRFLRGVLGKAEKQIIKIACVLHALKEWGPGGGKKQEVQEKELFEAMVVYQQCLITYTAAADAKGFVGEESELVKMVDYLQRRIERRKKLHLTVQQLRDGIKNTQPFSGQPKLMTHIREKILPKLEKMNYLIVDPESDYIFLNPGLR